MATAGQRRVVRGTVGWLLAVTALLAVADRLTVTNWVLGAYLGFLVLVELTSAVYVTPPWRRRLRLPLLVGLVGFVALAYVEGSETLARLLAEFAESG